MPRRFTRPLVDIQPTGGLHAEPPPDQARDRLTGSAASGILCPMPHFERPGHPLARAGMLALTLGLTLWSCRVESSQQAAPGTPGDEQASGDVTSPSTAPDASDASDAPAAEQVLIGDVNWYVDYDAALAIAHEVDKPLWVHFGENPG